MAKKSAGRKSAEKNRVERDIAARLPTEPPDTEAQQTELYDQAMERFHRRNFEDALRFFELVEQGPDVALRHQARVHSAICRRHLGSDTVELTTLEDRYNFAVQLINERELDRAESHLEKILGEFPDAAHVHYARASVAALKNEVDQAFQSLERAIQLDPQHRVLAKGDADLARIIRDRRIAGLLR